MIPKERCQFRTFIPCPPRCQKRKQDLLPATLGDSSYTATSGQAGMSRQVTGTFRAGKRDRSGTESMFSARHVKTGKMETQTKPHTLTHIPSFCSDSYYFEVLDSYSESLNSQLIF